MKTIKTHLLLFALFLFFTACNNKDANDCFQTAGTIVKEEFIVDAFSKIIVNPRVELFIQESNTQKIIIETGQNLLSDIVLNVTDNQLEISNKNTCNLVRNFGITKVYVYTNRLTEIRNSSTLPVQSIGVLNFDELALITENYLSDYLNAGDFNLEVNINKLSIVANGPSNHTFKGFVNSLNINFAGNNPRFDGQNLEVQDANLFARSTNDILITVSNKISGNLYSYGNVILFKKPNIMELEAHFKGKIIHNY